MPKTPEAVAVVEDDPGMREAMQRVLRASGFETLVFRSAEDFLEAGPLPSLGCLVVDVRLPGLSGPELHRRLRRSGAAAPVIFVTAHDTESVRQEVLALDPAAFLKKPFEGDDLVRAVGEVLSAGRTGRTEIRSKEAE
jgi:two-component system, LuxR family, response regulator FixJ